MVKEITLPFTYETCDRIHQILTHILLLSGPPSLIIGMYLWFIVPFNVTSYYEGMGLAIYGLIFTLASLSVYGESISDWYDDHRIIFNCKCDKQNDEVVK